MEVILPIDNEPTIENTQAPDERTKAEILRTSERIQCLKSLREISPGKTLGILNSTISTDDQGESQCREVLEMYCSQWFGFTVISSDDHDKLLGSDLVIVNPREDDWKGVDLTHLERAKRVLLVRKEIANLGEYQFLQTNRLIASIWSPAGPYKLARNILALFNKPLQLISNGTTLGLQSNQMVGSALEAKLPQASPVALEDALAVAPHPVTQMPHRTHPLYTPPPIPETLNDLTRLKALVLSKSQPSRPLHLLAVDDNTVNLHLLFRYLQKRKSDVVVTACNGLDAVAAVQAAPKPFDIIFMDISMPEMNGFEATRAIRKIERERGLTRQEIEGEVDMKKEKVGNEDGDADGNGKEGKGKMGMYIVALTGLGSSRDRAEADEAGFDDFLTKPIRFAKIGELLEVKNREQALIWSDK